MGFWVDFVKYAVASVLATVIPYWMMSRLSFNDLLLGLLLLPFIWVAPAIVLIRSFFMGKPGPVLGALCGIPLMLLGFATQMQIEASQVRAYDQRQFLPPERQHRMIAIENSHFAGEARAEGCSEFCLQMLFDGRYVPVLKKRGEERWTVFELAHGQACLEAPRDSRYLELLGRRYADTCIATTELAALPDALVIRENPGKLATRLRLESFCELIERTGGKEVLLSRWVRGRVEPSSNLASRWGLSPFYVGDGIDELAFYAQALDLPIDKFLPRGNAPIEDVLDGLRPFFGDPKTAQWAMYAFWNATSGGEPEEVEQARHFLQARIAELKASPDADPKRIEWFEGWLKRH